MLAEYAKLRAFDVLTGSARFAFPAAEGRKDDDLVTGLPGGVAAGLHHAGAVRCDDARGWDPLGAVGQPEVKVVDRGGLDGDRDGAGRRLGCRTLANPHARGPDLL